MKCTICVLLACSVACSAGRLRNSSSAPLQPDVNATVVAAAAPVAKIPEKVNATVAAAAPVTQIPEKVNATVAAAAPVTKIPEKVNATVAASAQAAKVPEKAEEKQMPRKVTMQIPDEEINAFLGKLSPGCEKQYTAMFGGQGSDLSTFGTPGVEATAESCQSLNGSLCATKAHIAQDTTNSSGRSMSTKVEVKGKGCLPKVCISESDLSVLAAFMHSKAKSSGTISGEGVDLDLHVDCTASGGSVAAMPAHEEEAAKPAEAHKEEHHDENKEPAPESEPEEHHDKHDAKSSAFRCGVVAMVPALLVQLFA